MTTPKHFKSPCLLSCIADKCTNKNIGSDMKEECLNCDKVRIEILNLNNYPIASLIPGIKVVVKKKHN